MRAPIQPEPPHDRPLPLPDHRTLARLAPRPAAAVFAAHAQRREGLDLLEETGLPYEPHLVRFDRNEQLTPEFLSLNPNNKIPAIIDPDGPGGRPLALFESGAILIYLPRRPAASCRPTRRGATRRCSG
jgi:hypothetical protein